ncbi:MAG: feruloyl-CoA synthase, partial [Rhodospirillaceae bacterium]|nr:feruloyl-CoA synthase [Rhodospirillaceae bacterium]
MTVQRFWTKAYPHAPLNLAPQSLAMEKRADGAVILKSGVALDRYPNQLGDDLRANAERIPDRVFLAERGKDGNWVTLTYGAARAQADAVSQWLLDHGHGPENPVAALSDNSIAMALLILGSTQVGIPFLPVSQAYSLMSKDYAKVKYVCEHFTPSLIYVENLAPFVPALKAASPKAQIVAKHSGGELPGVIPFAELLAAKPGRAVDDAFARVGPDSTAKILLTSGSTGFPKGVVNTQRMLTASMTQCAQAWRFLLDRPPVLCDWLPWNHTFGSNFCFNSVLRFGGTFYIDEGRPVPGRFAPTLRNLRETKPTILLNVARAYDFLLPEFEKDESLARDVFANLDMIFYAGAGLPQNLWDRLEAVSIKTRGNRIPILTSLGSTETSPPATICHWPMDVTGSIGLPIPGLEAKLVPAGDKTEIRFKGPNITPGYYRDPERTAEAFDEEGYYKIGDAVKWADPNNPNLGLLFDGRVAENFKLLTGTWVAAGMLRLDSLSAMAPLIQDAAVTGVDQEWVGLLAFPNMAACKAAIGAEADSLPPEAIVRHPTLQAQ